MTTQNKINQILRIAAQMPTGLNDEKAADKLLKEREELLDALADGDYVGALTEAADAGYYAVKHLQYVSNLLDISIEEVLELTVAKYEIRVHQPKNDTMERDAVLEALKK